MFASFVNPLGALYRLSAPGTKIPVLFNDAPVTRLALMLATGNFPGSFDFAATPWAIAHEGHQRLFATGIGTFAYIAFVRIAPCRFGFETRSVTPGAIIPVNLDAAFTARAMRRHSCRRSARRIVEPAPGASLHTLGDRSLATSALVSGIQLGAKLALKLTPLQLPPG